MNVNNIINYDTYKSLYSCQQIESRTNLLCTDINGIYMLSYDFNKNKQMIKSITSIK